MRGEAFRRWKVVAADILRDCPLKTCVHLAELSVNDLLSKANPVRKKRMQGHLNFLNPYVYWTHPGRITWIKSTRSVVAYRVCKKNEDGTIFKVKFFFIYYSL